MCEWSHYFWFILWWVRWVLRNTIVQSNASGVYFIINERLTNLAPNFQLNNEVEGCDKLSNQCKHVCCSDHYNDVIMVAIASQITSLNIVYSMVYSAADQRKHQSSTSLAFVWGIHRWPVNYPHKWPVTRKMFSFDDVVLRPFNGRNSGVTTTRMMLTSANFI